MALTRQRYSRAAIAFPRQFTAHMYQAAAYTPEALCAMLRNMADQEALLDLSQLLRASGCTLMSGFAVVVYERQLYQAALLVRPVTAGYTDPYHARSFWGWWSMR